MTLSLPPLAPRRVGPRMGVRVDQRLNPRVDIPATCGRGNYLTCGLYGVSEGIRTPDTQDHNLVL
jgi:hypothetical protein